MIKYSKIDELPKGEATKEVTPGCVIMEGGAFRGLYGEGAADALMKAGLMFESTVGVSAGALNGIAYLSGQIGRTGRINLSSRRDNNYVGIKSWIQTKSVINFDYLFGPLSEPEPLDKTTFFRGDRRFFITATCCETGEMTVFEKNDIGDLNKVYKTIQASSSMPFVSQMIDIDGKHYLDGGCSTKVPYQWAIDQGYEKILVIRTRPRDYRKKISKFGQSFPKYFYHQYPKFAQSLSGVNQKYNRECDEMVELEKSGRIFVIAPSEPVTVRRLESDMEKLGDLYWLGYHDTEKSIEDLKKYLHS